MRRVALSASLALGLLATTEARAQEPEPKPSTEEPKPSTEEPKPPQDEIIKGQRGWIGDANVGRPLLKSGEAKLAASGMIGHRWKRLELLLSGSINQYASKSDNVFNTTARAGWRLDGAYVTGSPGDPVRAVIILDISQALYLTRYRKLPEASDLDPGLDFDLNIKNEDSNTLRSSTRVGVLLAPSPRTQARAALGLGWQGEFYLMTTLRHDDSGTEAAFDVDFQLSLRQMGQAALRYQLLPGALAVRAASEASRFKLRRSSAAIKLDLGDLSATDARLKLFTLTQIESSNRLNLDIEKLTLFGVMPSLFAGVDVSLLRGDAGSAAAIVPVLGVGLTNGRL